MKRDYIVLALEGHKQNQLAGGSLGEILKEKVRGKERWLCREETGKGGRRNTDGGVCALWSTSFKGWKLLCFGLTCRLTVSLFWKMVLKAPIRSLGYANREQWVFPRVTGLMAWRSGTKPYCIMMKNVFHSFCGKSLISV